MQYKSLLAVTTMLGGIGLAEVAMAQEATMDEVVVTSRKRVETLQDTPISITAFTAEALEAKNILSIDQIDESAPNITFDNTTPFGPANSSSIIIRGIGLKDFTLVSEPGVGLYVDDIYIPHSIGNVSDVVDIERIEVLRGPQGTLFGRNTIGGAVRVITKKPDEEFMGKVEATVGSRNRTDFKASVNVPLSDELFVRLTGFKQDWDGYIDTPNLPDDDGLGDKDTLTFIGAARWLPSDNFTADLTMGYTDDNSGRQPSLLVSTLPAGEATGYGVNAAAAAAAAPNEPDLFDTFGPHYIATSNVDLGGSDLGSSMKLFNMGLTLDWKISDNVGVKSITSYRDLEAESYYDLDHSPLIVLHGDDFIVTDSMSQELQLYGDALNNRLNWTVGAYYFQEEGVFDEYVPFGTLFEIFSGGEIETESYAFFGQGTYSVTDKMDVTVGLRHSDDSKDWIVDADHQFFIFTRPDIANLSGVLPDSSIQRIQIIPIGTQNVSANSTDPYFNVSYDWQDNFMTYFTYSEGYKGGGFQERNAPGSDPDRSYDPEYATVYEIGAKWSSDDRRYTLNAAAFKTDYSNLQLNVVDGLARAIRNGGEADIMGFEAELIALPTDGLIVTGGVGYLDAEYTSITEAARIGGLSLDNELPGTPKWQVNGSVSYEIESGLGSFIPRVDFSHTSKQFNDATNNTLYSRDAHTLINASIGFFDASDSWNASVYVRNITDKQFFVAGFEDATREYTDAALSPPREWGLKLGYTFD